MVNTDIKKYMSMRMALRNNLLTSDICGNKCVFCSNKLNPDEVHTVKVGKRDINDLIEEIDFFPINIAHVHLGETNFNTTEGEIIEYPYFRELILKIKEKRPNATISITSSGNSLTEDVILFLKEHNINLVLSIHSLNPEIRAKLTGNTLKRAQIAIDSLDLCFKHNIHLDCVRLVPMPFVPDEDIYNTLKYLVEHDVELIHIWVASFSKFAEDKTVEGLYQECARIAKVINSLNDITAQHFSRIELDPFPGDECKNMIKNVKPYSYAADLGLKNNDEVIEINDELIINGPHITECLTKHDFIYKMIIKRNNQILIFKNFDGQQVAQNIVINMFIPMRDFHQICDVIKEDRSHTLIITSEASYPTLIYSLNRAGFYQNECHVTYAKNETFGGSICVNGLITIDDYLKALKQYREAHPETHITKIAVAQASFCSGEIDVTSRPLQELKFLGCVDVILI